MENKGSAFRPAGTPYFGPMVGALIGKEWRLEWRQKHALAGVVLFVLATAFVCYLALGRIDATDTWGALVWISAVFTSINAMQKSFQNESGGAHLYLYTLAPARTIILSKILYNALLIAALNLFNLFFFILFFGTEAFSQADTGQFVCGFLIGSAGLATALTFIAGLAFRSGAGTGLVAILGFPVIMPLLITSVRFSKGALEGLSWSDNGLSLLVLIVLNVALLILALVLFPYLWRD
jgi:heme exporter protein B